MNIAKKLRTTYGLGSRDLTFGEWNIEEFFAQELGNLEKIIKKRQEADMDVMSDVLSTPANS